MYNKIIKYMCYLILLVFVYGCQIQNEPINFLILTVESSLEAALSGYLICNGFVDVDELPSHLNATLKSKGYKDGENVIARLIMEPNSDNGEIYISTDDQENNWIRVGIYRPILSQTFQEWGTRQKQVRGSQK